MKPWTALVVNDMHTGFKGALWPKDFVWDGRSINFNEIDQHLWNMHESIQERVPPSFDFLIEVGDSIQGYKPLKGWYVHDSDRGVQAAAHISLMEPLRERANEYFIIMGSPWHEGEGSETMRYIAEKLGATPMAERVPVWDWLPLELDGVLLDFAHEISRAPVYPTTPLVREGRASRSAEAMKAKGNMSWYVFRGHTHRYFEHLTAVDDQPVGEMGLPCMKVMEYYAIRKLGPNQALDYHLGATFVTVYPDLRGQGLKTVHIEPMLYPKPKVAVVKRSRENDLRTISEKID